MSATFRISDSAENQTLFPSPPPIINVSARQHLVTVHFSRRTSSDYITEAIKKASKIHARLPSGGILIFLSGQKELAGVHRKLEAKYSKKAFGNRVISVIDTAKILRGRALIGDDSFKSVLPRLGRHDGSIRYPPRPAMLVPRGGREPHRDAINDSRVLSTYFLVKKHFRTEPYYVHLTELLHDVGIYLFQIVRVCETDAFWANHVPNRERAAR